SISANNSTSNNNNDSCWVFGSTLTESVSKFYENYDGAIQFGTSGVVSAASGSKQARAVAKDSTYLYVAGMDDNNDWRIEKRLLSDGSLVGAFGSSGVITGAAASNSAFGIAIDSTNMYVVGVDDNNDMRAEKRLLSDGSLVSAFGTSGVVTGAGTSK